MVAFDIWASRLRNRLRHIDAAAARNGAPRPAETFEGVLYVECYRYFRKLRREGGLIRLEQYLASEPSGRWFRHKRKGVENVLRLLERPGEPNFLQPARRGRIAAELALADRFDIHSQLLLAFLFEAGPHRRKLIAAHAVHREPWMRTYMRLSTMMRKRAKTAKAK